MKEIHSYKTSDGALFEDEEVAKKHESEILQIALADFFYLFEPDARDARVIGFLRAIQGKRENMLIASKKIVEILSFKDD